jgi:hypothetical protein
VTALHTYSGAQQGRVDITAGRPDPADVAGPLALRYGRAEVIMPNDAPVASAVPGELGQQATASRAGDDGDVHASDCPPRLRQPGTVGHGETLIPCANCARQRLTGASLLRRGL